MGVSPLKTPSDPFGRDEKLERSIAFLPGYGICHGPLADPHRIPRKDAKALGTSLWQSRASTRTFCFVLGFSPSKFRSVNSIIPLEGKRFNQNPPVRVCFGSGGSGVLKGYDGNTLCTLSHTFSQAWARSYHAFNVSCP